jgi:catechol 2,3-dioxygenase-like lactoylglutathione lyase family enzyme
MKITLTSVFVENQAHALKFYTEVLGFVRKTDLPAGQFRWLTVVSPEGPEGIELLLEPNANLSAATYQKAIFQQGIPAASFQVDDIDAEYGRLTALGVAFTVPPTPAGPVSIAVFNDTCGNLIQLAMV